MTDTTTPAPEHPFDPALPGRIDAFIATWKAEISDADSQPLAAVHTNGETTALTLGDVVGLRARDAYAEQTRLQLAEASASWRHEYEEQHLRADRLESEKAALGQTIAALPDATANGAANLAHARAERDRLRARLEAVRAVTEEWRAFAIGEGREIDPKQVAVAGHALNRVLDAIDGEPDEAGEAAQPHTKGNPLIDRLAADMHELNRQAAGRDPGGAKAFEPVLVYMVDELHKHLAGFATDRQAGAVLLVAAVAAAHIARQYPTAPQAVVNVIADAGERLYRGGGPALRKKK